MFVCVKTQVKRITKPNLPLTIMEQLYPKTLSNLISLALKTVYSLIINTTNHFLVGKEIDLL